MLRNNHITCLLDRQGRIYNLTKKNFGCLKSNIVIYICMLKLKYPT